jgi:hypothetical protein
MPSPSGLQIVLSTPLGQIFMPGSRVWGNALFTAAKEKKLSALALRFGGQAKQWNKLSSPDHNVQYRCQEIFIISKTILQGPCKLCAGTYSWPFEFEFPRETNLSMSESGTLKEKPGRGVPARPG